MRLPLNLFGFHGADNRAAPLSSAVFAALPSPAQSTLFSDVPQAHVPIDTYSPTYPPADQYANFSSGPIGTDLGSLGLDWNDSLLNESTASPYQTTSYDGAYLSTPGPSRFNTLATYALPDATEPEPAYYSPIYPPATSSIGDVECGFNTYLLESANPSFLSNRSAWVGPAPEEFPQPEERLIPVETACPEDCFDVTGLPLTPPAPLYDSPLQTLYNTSTASYDMSPSTASYNFSSSTASYDTSPSTDSFDGGLSEHCLPPYLPAATSVDSCSPTWASKAQPVLPPTQTAYNSSPSAASYDTSPSTVSYDTSPSTASFNGSLFGHYSGPYSPAATSIDSCSPTWPSSAKPVLPPSGTCLGRPAPYAITAASSWPIASSSKRRYEDDDVLEMPKTKRIKEVGEYQGLLLPPPVAGSSKRRLEDDEESVDEPLMKKMRKMKNKKRLARSAETRVRRAPTGALRHHKTLVAGSADCGNTTSDTRNEIHAYEVEGPEQTPSGSSSKTTQVENATPASSMPIQAAPVRKKQLRCPRPGCTNTSGFRRPAELNRHLLSVHTLQLKCPHGCPKLISRRDALSRHLEKQHGCEGRAAVRKARSIEDEALAAVGWRK